MALNIKNAETEALAADVARLTGETKTAAITTALRERRQRLLLAGGGLKRGQLLERMLAEQVWPHAPAGALGAPLTREEEEEILGFGPTGV
jgi:antitoxin VapB